MKSNPQVKRRYFFLTLLTLLIAIAIVSAGVSALDEIEQIMMSQEVQNQPMAVSADAGFSAPAAAAQATCANCEAGTPAGIASGPVSTAGLGSLAYSSSLHGGYTAAGVGMRNRGWGTILIQDVPTGATTRIAYLFWSVIGPSGVTTPPSSYAQGKFNGHAITGTYLGSAASPCWGSGSVFGYRANVTNYVTGNGVYHLTDFASANKWGDDPFSVTTTYPAIEGASLVDVYAKSNYPTTTIKIMNGVERLYGSSTSTTTFTSVPAYTLPVARTTFIVGDGQSNGGAKTITFDGKTLTNAGFLNGTDRQNGVDFLHGNLWDTNSALVKATPSATTATATISTPGDCLVWIAQVLSVSDGNLDTDGDALKDSWETYGYDYNSDGVIDVPLPARGASPYHKDAFIWVDYMASKAGEQANIHRPNTTVFTTAANTFADANYASSTSTINVDGTKGIRLHSYRMYQVAHQDNLAITSTSWAVVDTIKNLHMTTPYKDIFHYCLFAHGYDGGSSSGISRGIPAGDFIVSLGLWGTDDTDYAKTGTYIHEFGHNMGLYHGGPDSVNYKPNYLSVMNYFFQIDGVYRNGAWHNYDYQRTSAYTLNENSLSEANGIGTASAGYGTKWIHTGDSAWSPHTSTVNAPIDWNKNSVTDSAAVSIDINGDGSKSTLTPWLDWQHILYNGGSIGGISLGKTQAVTADKMPQELTHEQYRNATTTAK
jgi:hypothetical protein